MKEQKTLYGDIDNAGSAIDEALAMGWRIAYRPNITTTQGTWQLYTFVFVVLEKETSQEDVSVQ